MSNKNRNQQQYFSTKTATPKSEDLQSISDEDLQQQQDQVTAETNIEQVNTTEVKVVEEPIVKTKPAKVVESVTEQPKASTTQNQKGFKPVYKTELELTNYAEAMNKNNTIIPEQGGKWQYSLFNIIKSCFEAKTQEEFNREFATILNFFQKNKDGIFNEKFIFRFPENWPGSDVEYTQNRRIIYLIIQTADPKTRKKALEQINMELVSEGMPEAHKQMLFNFYQM